ncbi:hypothetical protein GCM10009841_30710 [Microlunatus panaciterrae]|uniref:Helicase n=1 Tax=Microlunatus panaciterrae TaxID=400768 RepID=A0ABS2RHQ0_9ACTN|nr:type ISP restriction/modification enzyme [Microlunatus panaciterrae]MBM7797731.1 putative helicase [Microlunatus panaciterrae]
MDRLARSQRQYGKAGQFFPRWTYKAVGQHEHLLSDSEDSIDGYGRIDNVSDSILADYQKTFGQEVTKDDIYCYVYGLLHSPQYRETFAADLKKMLPRIPKVDSVDDFQAFNNAGRRLADLHLGYETVEAYPLTEHITGTLDSNDREPWRVTKMRWRSKTDRSAIVYNSRVTLTGIPDEAHRYLLGSRTALEWLIDRYQVKTDNASGIVNDPDDWCDEHNDPRYIVDLIKRVTTVSVETVRMIESLPKLTS